MVREPIGVITLTFGPLGVAALERENSELACEVRGRVGDTAGDEGGCHGGRETDILQRIPLLKFRTGRDCCFEAGAEVAVHRPHCARCALKAGTGTIGSAVVAELLGNGHTALALARSDSSEQALKDAGAEVLRGGLADLDVLRAGAAQSDGVIGLAFSSGHGSPERLAAAIAEESAAVAALGEELIGSDRPIAIVSGTPWAAGRASTEEDPLPLEGPVAGRARSVNALLGLASRGLHATAVRMPRTVHNQGKGGFAGLLADQARRTGVAGYPGDGTQRWPAVHALDAAVLFRLALESAPAGTSWHAVADEGDAVRDIATVIGRRLGLPVQPVPEENFGPFDPIFAMDQPASSTRTRELLGWQPTHPSLLDDLENIQP